MTAKISPAHYRQRGSERRPVAASGQLRHQSWYSLEVRICDVSTGGFMAECTEPVRIGSYVSLEIPGIGPVHAQVRWQLGARMGGMFLDPINLVNCEWTAIRAARSPEPA